ncbi:MAG TPA: hypothetical protein VJ914_14995 [Pseudonocardiaceae bacterium]|nr:hypothetical protein [Pseudonocardiaceae bacterium]
MTMVISRSAKLLVTGAVGALLLAGCASGPGQAGSAAIVNGSAISLDTVQAELNNQLAHQPSAGAGQQANPADEARLIVTYAVLHQIDNAAVAQYHLNVSPQAVNEYTQELGGIDHLMQATGYSNNELQMVLRDKVVQMAYATRYIAQFQTTFDSVGAPDQKSATALAQKLAADPANARSIMTSAAAAGNSQPQFGTKLTGGQILAQQNQTSQQAQQSGGAPSQSILPLFAAKANSVLAFPIGQGQWVVLVVHGADTNGAASDQDKQAITEANPDDLDSAGSYLLSSLAQQLSIKVSPRYGVWDPIGMAVVPSAGQGGVEFPDKTTPAAS